MPEATEKPGVEVTVVGMTDVGRVRDHNEDNLIVLDKASGRRIPDGEVFKTTLADALVMAVCDGMGGAAAGEVASEMAADQCKEDLGGFDYSAATPDQVMVILENVAHNANESIFNHAEEHQEKKGMGTTMTCSVALGSQVFFGQVGDSRAYVLRKGALVQLTKDQSLVGQLIEEGTLTEEEAEQIGGKNIVLQAVGVEKSLKPIQTKFDLRRGDTILICSDGLSGMIKDGEMAAILNEHGDDLKSAAIALIKGANEGGGKDNITVILSKYEGEGLQAPLATVGKDEIDQGQKLFADVEVIEPPDKMKTILLVLGVIIAAILGLFAVFNRTTADIILTIDPGDQAVEVVITDSDGNEVHKSTVSNGRHKVPGVDTGEYVLSASADHYHDAKDVEFTVSVAGDVNLPPVRLQPKKAEVRVTCATGGVTVSVEVKADGAEAVEPFELPTAGTAREMKLPAGEVVFVARRAGFADEEVEATLEPEGDHDVKIGALTEVTAPAQLSSSVDGVRVVVQDPSGKSLIDWTSGKGAAAKKTQTVRVGRHSVTATKDGYEEFKGTLDVRAGAGGRLDITMQVALVPVVFASKRKLAGQGALEAPTGPDSTWASIGRSVPVGRTSDPNVFRSTVKSLAPGHYRIRFSYEGGGEQLFVFEVPIGADKLQVELP